MHDCFVVGLGPCNYMFEKYSCKRTFHLLCCDKIVQAAFPITQVHNYLTEMQEFVSGVCAARQPGGQASGQPGS